MPQARHQPELLLKAGFRVVEFRPAIALFLERMQPSRGQVARAH